MKFASLSAIAIAVVMGASSVAAPAKAGILGDIISAPVKVVSKVTGLDKAAGAAAAAGAAGKLQREQAARRQRVQGSQWAWLGEKEYVKCLKTHTNTQCNMSYFGVPSLKH